MIAPPRASVSRLTIGSRIASRYTVASVLGEGASGVVYLATRDGAGEAAGGAGPGERVALKVIHRHLCGDKQIFQRYHREAAILKRLAGEHIVRLLEFIEDDGLLIIALEYVEGPSLEEVLRAEAPLGADRAVRIALQVCAALEVAHGAGVVHRDLKPGNVLVERGGGREDHVRVVDFGLAKVVHGEHMTTGLTEQDMIFGTPEYMAPEQARGDEVDARCDVYALGCMLYEMVVGTVPFKRRTPIATMTAHLTEEPAAPRSSRRDGAISAGLEAVILRALAKRRSDRYATARGLSEALDACLRQARVVATPAPGVVDPVSATDLNLSRSSLEHSPTIPSTDLPLPLSDGSGPGGAIEGEPGVKDLALAATLPVESDLTIPSPEPVATPPRPRRAPAPAKPRVNERVLWIVVAVVFAAIGVAIGTLVGTR